MLSPMASNVTAPTRFLDTGEHTYAYRRFGRGEGPPLLLLQHFTGTLDNWDPAVTDPLATRHDVILFENAGVGRSSGVAPDTIGAMAGHMLSFLGGLGVDRCDVLGYSLGGMVALQVAQDRPKVFRRMVIVGSAPRGGHDVMHLEKPSLAVHLRDPDLKGYAVLQKLFFTPSKASQAAGAAFIDRLMLRRSDREPISGQDIAQAQMAAFREWNQPRGERFAELKTIGQPTLVVNGVGDEMIPVENSYTLGEKLPNAVLLTFPDSGHGSLFQYPAAFTDHVAAFLASSAAAAPYARLAEG